MVERRQIVEFWRRGVARALVTLVRAEGSSYRQPGARLLTGVAGDGTPGRAGMISGGCLEAEVVRKAEWIAGQGASVIRHSTLFDDTAEIPFGLGCGGTVDLLVEPMDTPEARALMSAMERSLDGIESKAVSFLPGDGRGLRRLILAADGAIVFASKSLDDRKIECARALEAGEPHDGRFVEWLRAPQRLVVLGAGEDARPLVGIAAALGWTVVVADGRAQLARAERFPAAEEVRLLGDAAELNLSANDAAVLMTHSYEQDRALLTGMLSLSKTPRYIGLLGSRHRSSLLIAEAAAALGRSIASCCEAVFAPVGLDLGGDGPEAIALAIVAEIQAFLHGRPATSHKLTPREVEEQIARGGSSAYLQSQCALQGVA